MLKILQARLQQYVNRELPDVQAGFRKGRGTRYKIANIHWIIEKKRRASQLQIGLSRQRQRGRGVRARARRQGAILVPETASSIKL